MTRRVAAGAALVLTLALGACGRSGSSPRESVADAGRIRSGVLDLSVVTSAGADPARPDARTGFHMSGPFDLTTRPLPRTRLRYEVIGVDRPAATFVSDGRTAAVVRDGSRTPVSAPAGSFGGSGGTGRDLGLDLGRWIVAPRDAGETTTDGVKLRRITGRIDPAAAMSDLARLAGGAAGDLGSQDAESLRAALQRSELTVAIGADDGLLRHLAAELDFAVPDPDLRARLGSLAGAQLRISLDVAQPNGRIPAARFRG